MNKALYTIITLLFLIIGGYFSYLGNDDKVEKFGFTEYPWYWIPSIFVFCIGFIMLFASIWVL